MATFSRRTFLTGLALSPLARAWTGYRAERLIYYPRGSFAKFSYHLKPVGRILGMPGYYVWCNSPIYGPAGRIHVFFSRWLAGKGLGGWLNGSEIAHP